MKRIGFAFLAIVPVLAFSATARAQLDRFQGAWDNTNPETRGIIRIRIDTAKVQVFGACHPNPCDWGQAEATAYGPGVSADLQTEARALLAHYKTAFSETILIIKPSGTDELGVESYTRFIDGSRRTAYMNQETFRRGAKGNAPANTESRRTKNIVPEEMWKRVKQCVFPTYTALAFSAQITGTVDIGLGISPEGDVGNYRVLSGHPLLVAPAVDAIRQWKFQPNVVQGEVTWTRIRALVRFNADGTTSVDLAPGILADNFGDPGTSRSSASEFPRPATAPTCKSVQPWTGAQAKEIEASEVSTGSYKNNYFALTFHFPSEWRVADRDALDSMDANMRDRGKTQYGEMPPNVHLATFPSYTLFYARTDGPLGSPGPSVRIWAEKEAFISSADQYFPNTHFLNDKTADGTRGPEAIEIGGTKFYRGDRWGKVDGRSVYQVRVVTFTRNLILAIDVDADSAATAEHLVKILAGIRINPAS